MSLSEEPARKLFIKQCSDLILEKNSEISRHRKWTSVRGGKSISVGLIWIQGVIIKVSESHDAVIVDDGTNQALVTSIKEALGFGSWIQKGQYLMVVGEVLSVGPDVKIKAVKLTHLVQPEAEILWILEVMHFWKYLEAS